MTHVSHAGILFTAHVLASASARLSAHSAAVVGGGSNRHNPLSQYQKTHQVQDGFNSKGESSNKGVKPHVQNQRNSKLSGRKKGNTLRHSKSSHEKTNQAVARKSQGSDQRRPGTAPALNSDRAANGQLVDRNYRLSLSRGHCGHQDSSRHAARASKTSGSKHNGVSRRQERNALIRQAWGDAQDQLDEYGNWDAYSDDGYDSDDLHSNTVGRHLLDHDGSIFDIEKINQAYCEAHVPSNLVNLCVEIGSETSASIEAVRAINAQLAAHPEKMEQFLKDFTASEKLAIQSIPEVNATPEQVSILKNVFKQGLDHISASLNPVDPPTRFSLGNQLALAQNVRVRLTAIRVQIESDSYGVQPTTAATPAPTPATTRETTGATTRETTGATTRESTEATTRETTGATTRETTEATTRETTEATTRETTEATTPVTTAQVPTTGRTTEQTIAACQDYIEENVGGRIALCSRLQTQIGADTPLELRRKDLKNTLQGLLKEQNICASDNIYQALDALVDSVLADSNCQPYSVAVPVVSSGVSSTDSSEGSSSDSKDKKGLSTLAWVGIGAAIFTVLAVGTTVTICCYRKRKQMRRHGEGAPTGALKKAPLKVSGVQPKPDVNDHASLLQAPPPIASVEYANGQPVQGAVALGGARAIDRLGNPLVQQGGQPLPAQPLHVVGLGGASPVAPMPILTDAASPQEQQQQQQQFQGAVDGRRLASIPEDNGQRRFGPRIINSPWGRRVTFQDNSGKVGLGPDSFGSVRSLGRFAQPEPEVEGSHQPYTGVYCDPASLSAPAVTAAQTAGVGDAFCDIGEFEEQA